MKTLFQCDLCGKRFTDPKECAEHETMHRKPSQIESYSTYHLEGSYFDVYPRHLRVRMDDGAIVKYHLGQVIKQPGGENNAGND